MTVTVDAKLIEIAQCLAATAAQLQTSDLRNLAKTFEKAASDLLAQAIKSSEIVRII
jgi:hypothetical protein